MNPDSSLDKLRQGSLWREFCDSLKVAGEQLLTEDTPDDDLTRAEGYRYLTRLLRLSLEKNVEFASADFPQFYSLSHETAKIGNDNPDNFYQNCAIDGSREYRIWGNRGTVAYLSLETKSGSFIAGGDMAPTGHVEIDTLQVDDDGNFELSVSAYARPGNWLPMTEHSDNLLVRQTFRNRNVEQRAQLQIECLNPRVDDTLDPENFSRQLSQIVPFVSGTASLFKSWMAEFTQHENCLPPNDQQMCIRAGGDPSIFYHNSRWRLAADEALLIKFTPPRQCRTWNFQLSNFWMESLDYRYHRISVSSYDGAVKNDGTVCIVVAHANPGAAYPNWLETTGHTCGAMLLRYVESTDQPPVHTTVVKLETLRTLGVAGTEV